MQTTYQLLGVVAVQVYFVTYLQVHCMINATVMDGYSDQKYHSKTTDTLTILDDCVAEAVLKCFRNAEFTPGAKLLLVNINQYISSVFSAKHQLTIKQDPGGCLPDCLLKRFQSILLSAMLY